MEKYQFPGNFAVYHANGGETRSVYLEIFEKRCYLQHGIALPAGATVFDVGANIGLASLFFHRCQSDIRLFCFEPIPQTFAILNANLAFHQVPARVFNAGLSNTAGRATFTHYPNNTVMSGMHGDPEGDRQLSSTLLRSCGLNATDIEFLLRSRFEAQHVECPLLTLSEVIEAEAVEKIDLLKVDVEKSEWDVLRGLKESDWPKISQIVAEVHDTDGRLAGIRELLCHHGFEVLATQDAQREQTGLYNVFARKTR
jgi:31-O-methyltransferase